MASAFLKLGDIKGQSTDSEHKEWINIDNVVQSISRPMEAGERGAASQNTSAQFGDIIVQKRLDKSSPLLAEAIADGKNFDEVVIEFVTKVGAKKTETFYKVKLEDVRVSDHNVNVSSDGIPPSESISLNYRTIEWTYTEFDEKGSSQGDTKATWNVGEDTP